MTATEGMGTAATVPVTYDPETIFCEEWARIVPKWLTEDTPAQQWDAIHEAYGEEITGRVLGAIPVDTYRLLCRAAAHGWCGLRLGSMEEEHRKQASAMKRFVTYDLKQGAGAAKCAVFDLEHGLIRECAHEHKESKPTPRGLDVTIDGNSEAARALVDILRNAGVLGGV